tara:strand:- start:52 stop:282 length:231 start_codon:yes stop_codon:yes gene_type:complete
MFDYRTIVVGLTVTGKSVYGDLYGTWNPNSAARWARNKGAAGLITVYHRVYDMSGGGRGGVDAEFFVTLEHKGGGR